MQAPPPPFGGFDAFALGGSRILFLLTAVGALATVRVVAGLMLAFGPFFIAFLMFDGTRSLFEAWIRVLAGAALAAVGVTIALGLELALLEPWLSGVLARRMAGEALPTMPAELFVLVTLFTLIVIAALYGCARAVHAFRLPQALRVHEAPRRVLEPSRSSAGVVGRRASADAGHSRSSQVARMLSTSRRDVVVAGADAGTDVQVGRPSVMTRPGEPPTVFRPIGRSHARRSTSRVSARANRRDMGA